MADNHQDEPERDPHLTVTIDLVRRAKAGSPEALNRLFDRYYDRVRSIVNMRLGPKLKQFIESSDILQETFFAAVRTFDRFEMRDEASFINWLSQIAENQIRTAADHRGAQKRHPDREEPRDEATNGHGEPVATGLLPPEEVERREGTAVVEESIATLTPLYRELIILRTYAGASWETVAEQTSRPSAAAARMMYAKAMVELGKAVRRRMKD